MRGQARGSLHKPAGNNMHKLETLDLRGKNKPYKSRSRALWGVAMIAGLAFTFFVSYVAAVYVLDTLQENITSNV